MTSQPLLPLQPLDFGGPGMPGGHAAPIGGAIGSSGDNALGRGTGSGPSRSDPLVAGSAGPADATEDYGESRTARRRIDKARHAEVVRALSVLRPWRSLLAIAAQWAVIAAAAAAAIASRHALVYLAAMFVIATRQHALGILAHEATHYRLHPSRTVNELLGDWLCTFPLGMFVSLYRRHHLQHHRYTNTVQDTDQLLLVRFPHFHWPKTPRAALGIFARDALGARWRYLLTLIGLFSPWATLFETVMPPAYFATPLKAALPRSPKRAAFFTAWAIVLGGLVWTGQWPQFLVLWVLPSFTFLAVLFRLRELAEHFALPGEHELNDTRTVIAPWYERLILAPCNVNYHLEHHLFPSVPFYNLPQLHRALMLDPVFRAQAHITPSYLGVFTGLLAELTRPATRPPSASHAAK